jgi:hypothetical protein
VANDPVKAPIPVLLVVGRQKPLIESALAAHELRRPTIDIRDARMPAGTLIDPNFGAVPIGGARPGALSMAALRPTSSEKFVVRAFAETQDGQIPETIDGSQVFSQPRIDPILTCGPDPPLGNATTVATALNCAALKANGLAGKNVAVAITDTGINLA